MLGEGEEVAMALPEGVTVREVVTVCVGVCVRVVVRVCVGVVVTCMKDTRLSM